METWITPSLIVSSLALLLSALTVSYNRKRDTRGDWKKDLDRLQGQIDDAEERLAEIEATVKVLKMQMELFWKTVEQQMAKKFRDE